MAKVTNVVVQGDEGAWSRFQSQERCNQWGVDAVDSFGTVDHKQSAVENSYTDEDDFSCVTLMDELEEMECRVSEDVVDQAVFSGVPGGISESSNCWNTFLNNQDYQRTIQTDENFINSLIVDDVRLSGQFHSNVSSTKLHGSYSNLNNLTIDMDIGSPPDLNKMQNMGSYEHSDTQGFPDLYDWEKKQSDASHLNLSNMMNKAVPLGDLEDPPQLFCAGRKGDQVSVEETVLQELGSTVNKMTDKTRLCFRDALYRLAAGNSDKHGACCTSEKSLETSTLDRSLRALRPMLWSNTAIALAIDSSADYTIADQKINFIVSRSVKTNKIDRTVADFMMQNIQSHQ